jgi:hypothetical protein
MTTFQINNGTITTTIFHNTGSYTPAAGEVQKLKVIVPNNTDLKINGGVVLSANGTTVVPMIIDDNITISSVGSNGKIFITGFVIN